jgi:sugar transferase (PEP-CTERM/EpsH1 system associated)
VNILYLTARFPYPPLKGDQVRAYHQIRLLSQRHRVTLLSFADDTLTEAALAHLRGYCVEIVTVPISRVSMGFALLRHATSPEPFQTMIFRSSRMARALHALLRRRAIDVVVVQLARLYPYVADLQVPVVVDLIDALSANIKRRASQEARLKAALLRAEARRLERYERAICTSARHVVVVSARDRDAIGTFPSLQVNGNGVDLDAFPARSSTGYHQRIMFTGNMSYFPNVNAVVWFAREVLPLVLREIPDAHFEIVGVGPSREVLALAGPHVSVAGYVEDMPAKLAEATVAVAPMLTGSGMQNKVIEAMASSVPLVVTPLALGGLEAVPGHHVLTASDAPGFAREVIRLISNPELASSLARAGRQLVEHAYTWEKSVEQLETLLIRATTQAG